MRWWRESALAETGGSGGSSRRASTAVADLAAMESVRAVDSVLRVEGEECE